MISIVQVIDVMQLMGNSFRVKTNAIQQVWETFQGL